MRALVHRVGLVLCLLIVAASPVHADSASPWTAGPNAVGDDTYSGFIDTPVSGGGLLPNASVVVQGWVVDRSASGWSGIDAVEVYLGFRDQGGTLMNRATMGLPRDD